MSVTGVSSPAAVPMTDVAASASGPVSTKHRATAAPLESEKPAAKRARTESASPSASAAAPMAVVRPKTQLSENLWFNRIFPFLVKIPTHPGESVMPLANRDLVVLHSASRGYRTLIQNCLKRAITPFVKTYQTEIERIQKATIKQMQAEGSWYDGSMEAYIIEPFKDLVNPLNKLISLEKITFPALRSFSVEIMPQGFKFCFEALGKADSDLRIPNPRRPLEFQIMASALPDLSGPEKLHNLLMKHPKIFDDVEYPYPFFFERDEEEDGCTLAHMASKRDKYLPILKWLYSKPILWPLLLMRANGGESIAEEASYEGALEVLKWIFSIPELRPLVYAPYPANVPYDEKKPDPRWQAWDDVSLNVANALREHRFEILDWYLTEPLLKPLLLQTLKDLKKDKGDDYSTMLEWAKDRPELKKELETLGYEVDSSSTDLAPMSDE